METHIAFFFQLSRQNWKLRLLWKTVGPVSSNWHPLIETPLKDITDPTNVNEDSSRKKRKSGNDNDKDEIDNENQKAVKLQRKYFNVVIKM